MTADGIRTTPAIGVEPGPDFAVHGRFAGLEMMMGEG